jgi:hypothetical protein
LLSGDLKGDFLCRIGTSSSSKVSSGISSLSYVCWILVPNSRFLVDSGGENVFKAESGILPIPIKLLS